MRLYVGGRGQKKNVPEKKGGGEKIKQAKHKDGYEKRTTSNQPQRRGNRGKRKETTSVCGPLEGPNEECVDSITYHCT